MFRLRRRYRRRPRRTTWHPPENLPGQAQVDAALGRTAYVVYVLATDYGHYVGHSGALRARIDAHITGQVMSTAGGRPQLIWRSRPLPSRADAARLEAALKSLRDQASPRFAAITGFHPQPFCRLVVVPPPERDWTTAAIAGGIAAVAYLAAVIIAALLI